MTVRKRRKKNKLRGQRTHGRGDTKNRRGAGNRGGRGRAGSHKHKFSKYYGVFGTERKGVKGKTRLEAINLDDLARLIPVWEKEKKIEKNGKTIFLDGKNVSIGKILGRGETWFQLHLKNVRVSSRAAAKIENAKGTIETTQQGGKKSGHS